MITYAPFWKTIKAKKLTTYKLIKTYKISGNTINRLKHNKPIDTNTIERLCTVLKCDVRHILKFVITEQTDGNAQQIESNNNQPIDNNGSHQIEQSENDDTQLNDTADINIATTVFLNSLSISKAFIINQKIPFMVITMITSMRPKNIITLITPNTFSLIWLVINNLTTRKQQYNHPKDTPHNQQGDMHR